MTRFTLEGPKVDFVTADTLLDQYNEFRSALDPRGTEIPVIVLVSHDPERKLAFYTFRTEDSASFECGSVNTTTGLLVTG